MEYIIGVGVGLLLMLLLIKSYRAYGKKKIKSKEQELKKEINAENIMLKQIYNSSKDMSNIFTLKQIGYRLIAHGEIAGHLLMIKYKKDRLRVGIPWEFNTKERYHDAGVNLIDFADETHFVSIGSENFFLYYEYLEEDWDNTDLMTKEVIEGVRKMKLKIKKFKMISDYEEAILNQEEFYN